MCKQEQNLITTTMLGDPLAHCGHQFVYGWYLRYTIHAEILLWLMGRTEGLDCQRSVSPHFSFQASKVPPCAPLLHLTSLFCHHLSMVTESLGIWRRERECQLALVFLTNLFLSPQGPCDDSSLSRFWRDRICFSTTIEVWKWVKHMFVSIVPGCMTVCTY